MSSIFVFILLVIASSIAVYYIRRHQGKGEHNDGPNDEPNASDFEILE